MKKHPLAFALVFLFVIRVLIAVVTPVFETSEARYAAISANMARTGDFLVPRFTYKDRYRSFDGKPPLLFQLGGACCRAFGVHPFSVRLPALCFVLAMIAFLHHAIRRVADLRRARLAVVLAATSVSCAMISGFCMTDGLLTACVAGAIFSYLLFLETRQRNWSLGVFVSLAIGMLVKGPVALALVCPPILLDGVLNHRLARLKEVHWFSGIGIFLLVAAPWFVLRAREDMDFLVYFFLHENLLRFLSPEYGDRYGAGREFFRGMAVIWAILAVFPWSLPCLRRIRRARPGFLACTLIWMIGFWSLTSRIPMAYLIPIVPIAAAWLAIRIPDAELPRLEQRLPAMAWFTSCVLVFAALAGSLLGNRMPGATAPYHRNRYSYEFYHGTPARFAIIQP